MRVCVCIRTHKFCQGPLTHVQFNRECQKKMNSQVLYIWHNNLIIENKYVLHCETEHSTLLSLNSISRHLFLTVTCVNYSFFSQA